MSRLRNPLLGKTLVELRKRAEPGRAPLWETVAADLAAPRSRRAEVSLAKIDRLTKRGDLVVVPGKVLGTGVLTHSVTVGAYAFSVSALRKIRQAKGAALGLPDFIKLHNAKGVKLIAG